MKPKVVLSLFDGMSCGQIAFERLGIPIKTYYASEIDPYPIKVTQANYPDTVQLGDVRYILRIITRKARYNTGWLSLYWI